MTNNVAKNILIVGPSWIGDMVMAQSLFIQLKNQYKNCHIDVIAPSWSVPVLERMPEVRSAITLDIAHGEVQLTKRYRLGKVLRNKYHKAIILPRSLKAALVPFFANVPIRTGFLGEFRYGLINDVREFKKEHLNQTVKRFVALGLSQDQARGSFDTPQPLLNCDKVHSQITLKKLKLDDKKQAIALFPGAEYGPAKQWPIAYYRELANKLIDDGFQVWVMGSQKDNLAAEEIVEELSKENIFNLCGKTSIAEAIDLITIAKAAVSNDSGLMHVAAATGCPVVGIYGSSSPLFTPPLTKNKQIETLKLDCSPCFQRQCPLGHLDCLTKIKPERIFQSLKMLLS
jgi:heptosyltransferase-2